MGNLLIATSLLILAYIYIPYFLIIFSKPDIPETPPAQGLYIAIPKIGAYAPIQLDVDPWDKGVYRKALAKGVAQAKGTAKPGERGTIYLFAHSSDSPLNITRYNTIFLKLGQLNKYDKVLIYKDGQTLSYIVKDKKEVWPKDISYLEEQNKDQLILQTCTPIGTDLKRLLIFAEPS